MLRERTYPKGLVYRPGSDGESIEFFMNSFSNSKRLDLLLGYFSSTAIRLFSIGFAQFIQNGGVLRLIINDVLSDNDLALVRGEYNNKRSFNLDNFSEILTALNGYDRHFFECLSFLIKESRIELCVIKPKEGSGIAHFKSGVFYDDHDAVYFHGSANFSFNAFQANLEETHLTLSWDQGGQERVISQEEYFNNILEGANQSVEILDPSALTKQLRDYSKTNLQELLDSERNLLRLNKSSFSQDLFDKLTKKFLPLQPSYSSSPKFPYRDGPREYQKTAYLNWVENGEQGIFAMATGTGKTITSLNCLLEGYKKTDSYRALILVPTITLVNQWVAECKKFNFSNIVSISSKSNWEQLLERKLSLARSKEIDIIIISTYASFCTKRFQFHLGKLPSNTLLIADEMHNIGAPSILKTIQEIPLTKRIGLSATPLRAFDDDSNDEMNVFFNDKPPYVVSFSMEKALEIGWLCNYKYYPHIVPLTEEEQGDYYALTKQIAVKSSEKQTRKIKEEIQRLLLLRKNIINKAENKINVFRQIIKTLNFSKDGLKYLLVYTPEGYVDLSKVDIYMDSEEDLRLINKFTQVITEENNEIFVSKFTSETKHRESTLRKFESGEINVLTSMKCLDEGIDVPRSQIAIFCSSTGNPRQFIQRRGRVLRQHKDKRVAIIHDLIVVPSLVFPDLNAQQINTNKSLLKSELSRVVDFSTLALNSLHTEEVLADTLNYYDLNLYHE